MRISTSHLYMRVYNLHARLQAIRASKCASLHARPHTHLYMRVYVRIYMRVYMLDERLHDGDRRTKPTYERPRQVEHYTERGDRRAKEPSRAVKSAV